MICFLTLGRNMNGILLLILTSVFLVGCSLDANLFSGDKASNETPNTDTPTPGITEALQVQKMSFDFYIRQPTSFARRLAATADGNFLFVTAEEAKETFPFSLGAESSVGAVVVFKKSGSSFTQHQVLQHPAMTTDYYGGAVGASNEWLVVGTLSDTTMEDNSSNDPNYSGSAILYKWNSSSNLWEYSQKLKAPAGSRHDDARFGAAFAIDGNRLAVYAQRADNTTYNSGAVFMYNFDGSSWQFVQKINAAVPVGYRNFGAQPIFSGGKLFLSETDNGIPGRVDIFEYDGSLWNKTASVSTAVPQGSACGEAIAVQGDLIAMACSQAYDGGIVTGVVNIFKHNGTSWVDAGTFTDGTATEWGYFGLALHFAGNYLYVSGGHDMLGGRLSKFEIASSGTATNIKTILPDRRAYGLNFGYSLVVSNNILFANQEWPIKLSDVDGGIHLYDVSSSADTYLGSVSVDAIAARSLSANANFGSSIAVSSDGNSVMVGSPGNPYQDDYPNGGPVNPKTQLGSVQFFKKKSDKTLSTLGARSFSDNNRRDANMLFGQAISASGNYAVVGSSGGKQWFGAPHNAVMSSGLVSVNTADFNDTTSSWGNPINVFPPDDADSIDSLFGEAVKLKDTHLIVGAPEHKLATGSKYGKVFTFSVDYFNWGVSTVTDLDAGAFKTADMRFGASIDYHNGVLVVGAPGASQTPDAQNAANAGGVWIYNYDGTTATLQNILMGDQIYAANGSVLAAGNSSTWQAADGFGSSVLVSGTKIYIGSPGASSGAGAVFVYNFNSVSGNYDFVERLDMTLHAGQTATANAGFGTSLLLAEDLLVVGAPKENLDSDGANPLSEAGAVYILKDSGEGFKGFKKVTPTGTGARTTGSLFGHSLAYAAQSLYVGSPGHDLDASGADSVTGAGAIFVFDVSGLVGN